MLYPLLCLIVLFLSIVLWIYHWKNPRCNGKLPPGSMGLPVVGESFQLFTLQYLRCFTIHQKENQQIVVSTDTDVNRFIFQQKGKLVQSWYMDSFDDIVGKENVLSSHGFLHKCLRNLILNLFGSESLKEKHVSEMEELTSKHLRSWSCQQPSMIYDFTVRKLFGCNNEKLRGCYSAFLDGLISFPLNIPGTAYWKCLQGHNKAMRVIKIMLEERRGTLTKKQDKDFLDVVLEEMNKAGTILSEQTALDLLFALPFAAFESASSAVVLALQYLQSNPLALAELTQEHETILRERETKGSGITWKEYKSMTFTHMVIDETIRLGNIVPAIFRKVVKDIEIKGRLDHFGLYTGSSFEPHEIRGSTYVQSMVMEGSKFFKGFGSGVRLCASAEFVKLQISIFLHHFFRNYRWTVMKEGKAVRQPGLVFPDGFHVQILNKKFI
ncbi:hypothetical protein CXB51_033044 [Gossypium anomalum]|uniref:Cytochrome P450 n=1 Tax=Gossypium anomalum TaxID=47600 RepID=A0A8J5YDY6_9ROSI|nr:hypothetical protein CXB51_033044 [Gossypium anomalum]